MVRPSPGSEIQVSSLRKVYHQEGGEMSKLSAVLLIVGVTLIMLGAFLVKWPLAVVGVVSCFSIMLTEK